MRSARQPSDEALFAAWRAGDAGAGEALFRRWQTPLHPHVTRMLDDAAAADDIVVETFLRLHCHRDRWREGAAVRPFLFTIARNLARNRLRERRRWGWLPLAVVAERTAPPPQGGEVGRRVAAAFAALPPAQREACSLRVVAELAIEDIARITRVPVGTVKSRLFHGLRRLRALAMRAFALEPAVQLVPIFLLPVLWGFWNWLRVRMRPRVDIGAWGAVLGAGAGVAVNVALGACGAWSGELVALPVLLPFLYYLLWHLVVGPLNEALGVEDGAGLSARSPTLPPSAA